MKAPSGFIIFVSLAVAACTPNQTGRPVTQASVVQPQTAMRPNHINPAQTSRPSIEEMFRTRGPGWVRTATNSDLGYYFIHNPTISRQSDIAKAWILFNSWNSQPNNNGFLVSSTLYQSEFDCSGRRSRISDLQQFSERGALGQSQFIGGASAWRAVTPNSINERNMEVACQGGTQALPPTDNTIRPPQTPGRLGPLKDPV
jgi:hypothetical protein